MEKALLTSIHGYFLLCGHYREDMAGDVFCVTLIKFITTVMSL